MQAEAGNGLPARHRSADRLRLRPGQGEVRATLRTLRERWQGQSLPDELCDRAELILAEVLNNVVEHALCGCADGWIEVRCHAAADGILFEVADNGRPMPGGSLPKGDPPFVGSSVPDLPEGGFGWFLVRTIAADLQYRREEGVNQFSFRLRSAAAGNA